MDAPHVPADWDWGRAASRPLAPSRRGGGGTAQVRKKQDLYIWLAKSPEGPSVKFLVANVHTMAEVG